MELITIRSQIETVAERWDKQYPPSTPYEGKRAIAEKLHALDKATATAEDVRAIIGNSSWACPQRCGECQGSFDTVVMVGEDPDCESATAYLCVSCLKKAFILALEAAHD